MELFERLQISARRRRRAIQEKVHPALAPMLHVYKEALTAAQDLGPNPPAELVAGIQAHLEKELQKIAKKYPEVPIPAAALVHPNLLSSEPIEEAKTLLEAFHFWRHMKALPRDLKADISDTECYKRFRRTLDDYQTLAAGRGPIKRFKADLDHMDIFLWGLGMGLERLTAQELADFFEENCWCGKTHDADALKKQRKRILKALSAAAKPADAARER